MEFYIRRNIYFSHPGCLDLLVVWHGTVWCNLRMRCPSLLYNFHKLIIPLYWRALFSKNDENIIFLWLMFTAWINTLLVLRLLQCFVCCKWRNHCAGLATARSAAKTLPMSTDVEKYPFFLNIYCTWTPNYSNSTTNDEVQECKRKVCNNFPLSIQLSFHTAFGFRWICNRFPAYKHQPIWCIHPLTVESYWKPPYMI